MRKIKQILAMINQINALSFVQKKKLNDREKRRQNSVYNLLKEINNQNIFIGIIKLIK